MKVIQTMPHSWVAFELKSEYIVCKCRNAIDCFQDLNWSYTFKPKNSTFVTDEKYENTNKKTSIC